MRDDSLSSQLIEAVGGEKNIKNVVHCTTRLRFILKDDKQAQVDQLEKLEGVISVRWGGGQLQLVIGNHVQDIYVEILAQVKKRLKENSTVSGSIFNYLVDLITSIFLPLIGVMVAAGMLTGFLSLAVSLDWLDINTGTYRILHATANSFFFFLPIILGYTAAKKFGGNPFITMVIGGALVHPDIVSHNNFLFNAEISDATVPQEYFLGLPITYIRYSYSVIPIIFSAWINSVIEKKLIKIIPSSIRNIFVPFLCLVITAVATFLLIGPLSSVISDVLLTFFQGLYTLSPLILGAIIGATWQVLVIFGVHWGIVPIIFNNMATIGYDPFIPMTVAAVFGQVGAGLAVALRTKSVPVRNLATSSSITGFFGITEPIVYSINLPRKWPFIIGCISGGLGGMVMVLYNVKAYSLTMPNVLSVLVFIPPSGIDQTILGSIISISVALVTAFIFTFIFYSKGKSEKEAHETGQEIVNLPPVHVENNISERGKACEEIVSPMQGTIIPLEQLRDSTFSSGIIGKGIAIKPENGRLVSPITGKVEFVFKTQHSIGLKSDAGSEILIHIGIDTVRLNGQFFKCQVSEGQNVKQGELLIEFDTESITNAGYDITTPVLITNYENYMNLLVIAEGEVKELTPLMTCT